MDIKKIVRKLNDDVRYWKDLAEQRFEQLKQKERKIQNINAFTQAFNCYSWKEFETFIGTFMLAPHEEQTLIQDLRNKLKTNTSRVCEKISNELGLYDDNHRIIANNGMFGYETIIAVLDKIENEGKDNE